MNITTPDLSHLTNDEKKIIQSVINRQKSEEYLDDDDSTFHDYSSPSITISSRPYFSLNQSDVICQICQKTKFINEQSSRQCSVCRKRFCVHCGIRLKSQYYLCHQCQEKQEEYFSSTKKISKQYLSDYILSQTHEENPMNQYGANQNRIVPQLKLNINDDEISSPESLSISDKKKRLLPEIKQNILRDFQYHSLEDRDLGQESTLKDSGIDTASSSTILNLISSDQFKQPMTYWRFNEPRTEQTGYVYLKNTLFTYEHNQERINKSDIFDALGLKIRSGIEYENDLISEITNVIPGSIADTYGQLRVGDQILEWNGEKLTNLNSNDVNRIICQISMQSQVIHLIVKRSIRSSLSNTDHLLSNRLCSEDQIIQSTIAKNSIQLQISFRYDEKDLHVMISGARNIPIQQGLFACQLFLQSERDILSKEEKCTKAQPCSSGICKWNQHIIFFDIKTIDNILLWIKLINLDNNQEILGEMKFHKLNLQNQSEWYNLNDSSFTRILPSTTDIPSTTHNRKRQLPDIPAGQLYANREKVSQDLFQKATELKLRLHMQSTNEKFIKTQWSLDQMQTKENNNNNNNNTPRKSMVNLSAGYLKEKPRIPIIRDKSVPNSNLPRRTTMTAQTGIDLGKTKLKSLEEKYRKAIKKRHSLETPGDDIDSDGSVSMVHSTHTLPSQLERSRNIRKHSAHKRSTDHFDHPNEIQLNEEELRQMEMRTYDTTINSNQTTTATKPIETKTSSPIIISTEKISKPDQRNDGTLSDSVLSSSTETTKKRRPSIQSKAFVILGLSKKANSSSNPGFGKRSGFQRSEEIGVQPHLRNRALLERQTSKENGTPTSAPPTTSSTSPFNSSLQRDQYHSIPNDMKLWSGALKLPHEHQFTEFIEGLGTGQLVGRQVLASPCHGEIQIGLRNQNGLLEVEIVRARKLLQKPYYKTPPAPYVKVYLLDGKNCIEKQRTRITRRTLDPLIQQTLIFKESFREKVLQISIWGDYGKFDRKVFMGVCQIGLGEVNLNSSQQILDWYKLFSANSLINNYTIVQQSFKKNNSIIINNRS